MDAGLAVQLATSAATTLVAAAATDAWRSARSGFARLLGRGDPHAEEVAGRRLDALADEVVDAPADQREEVRQQALATWQVRLSDLLEERPEDAEPMLVLLEEVQTRLPPVQQQGVQHITAAAPGSFAQGVMFGNVVNHPVPVRDGRNEDSDRSPL
ncbi:hypothetical protein [Micromonospora sp. L32]|uniref:hypothetical protein n=1 Tax=Micromonospora sp. L32 TaxID=3452214 RepID=UPI003F8AB377